MFFHHPMGTFDLTGKEGVFRPAELPQPHDIFLVVAKEPATLLREYALLTGLPPLWTLGVSAIATDARQQGRGVAGGEDFSKSRLIELIGPSMRSRP